MEKFCRLIGFTKEMTEQLISKKEPLICSGKIYSEEHKRKFNIKNDTFKVEKDQIDDTKLILTINKIPISEWFREQWEKIRQSLREPIQEQKKSRGFRL